jgi:nicotinamide-nucleotide amidase
MLVEILATGDEVLTGSLVDTNTAWLAERLEAVGLNVVRHHTVGDRREILPSVFWEVGGRAEVALVTGGLGPTADDLCTEAAATAAGVPLELIPSALASVRAYFESRGREMPPSNEKQARLPRGAEVLDNPVGTAPGFAVTIGNCRFFFMPGVPHEMRRMFRERVRPRLNEMLGGNRPIHRTRTITSFGLPESTVGERMDGFDVAFPGMRLGLRAAFPEIHVKLYAADHDEDAIEGRLDAASRWVAEQLGHKTVSLEGKSLEAALGDLLRDRGETLAAAESCTGGLIADQITDVAGSSDYFLLSAVTYANEAKIRLLGVNEETLKARGAVSEETVREMADGVRKAAGATYGIATSGIAGPGGGTDEKPVGTVCVGLATPEEVLSRRYQFQFPRRRMNKQIFAAAALDLLRKHLLHANGKSPFP